MRQDLFTYAESAMIRTKLRQRMRGRKLRNYVYQTAIQSPDSWPARYKRMARCARSANRYRISDISALLAVLGEDPLHFLDSAKSGYEVDRLRLFEPVEKYDSDVTGKTESNSRIELRSAIQKHAAVIRGMAEDYIWVWPGKALSDAQYIAISRKYAHHPNIDKSVLRAEAQAENLREHWQIGLGPVPSMRGILFRAGVALFVIDLRAKRRMAKAVSGIFGEVRFVGLTREFATLPSVEKRRQLAVQLGRLYLRDLSADGTRAELFARAFLVPEDAKELILGHQHTSGGLRRCAAIYGVSDQLLMQRLDDWSQLDVRWQKGTFSGDVCQSAV